MLPVLGLIVAALAAGVITYLAVTLTISFIKSYRQRKQSKVVAADVKQLMKAAAKDPSVGRVSFDDLEDGVVIAEYDEYDDEIVQVDCAKGNKVDSNVNNLLNRNNGIILIED